MSLLRVAMCGLVIRKNFSVVQKLQRFVRFVYGFALTRIFQVTVKPLFCFFNYKECQCRAGSCPYRPKDRWLQLQTGLFNSRIQTLSSTKLHFIFLENGVMITPKRWLLTLIFACLCFKKSLLIK